jgi:hypothetical protein
MFHPLVRIRAYYLNPEFHTLWVMCEERNFYISKVNFRPFVKTAFQLRSKVRDQNKTEAPHVCCIVFRTSDRLAMWVSNAACYFDNMEPRNTP